MGQPALGRLNLNSHHVADHIGLEVLPSVRTTFAAFAEDETHFALVLNVAEDGKLQCLTPLPRHGNSFQSSLNQLEGILTLKNSCYIIIRRDKSLVLVTYVPYRANDNERASLLEEKRACVRELGEELFFESIICKEVGEITDIRSWEERDAERHSEHVVADHTSDRRTHDVTGNTQLDKLDARYKKNKCRLCDRRMKNKLSPEASEALRQLQTPGTAVQMVTWPVFPLFNRIVTCCSLSKSPRRPSN